MEDEQQQSLTPAQLAEADDIEGLKTQDGAAELETPPSDPAVEYSVEDRLAILESQLASLLLQLAKHGITLPPDEIAEDEPVSV